MAYSVEWSDDALSDLTETVSYLIKVLASRQSGLSFKTRVNSAMRTISARPLALPMVSDEYLARRGYRRAMAGRYLLLFRVVEERAIIEGDEPLDRGLGDDGIVRVVRVFHAAQDYPGLV